MKKFYILFVLLFVTFSVKSQIINIPDPIFKSIITNPNPLGTLARDINGNIMVVDVNLDGEIQISEALNVYSFSCGARNINSLTGIEYFTNLTSLSFNANNLTSINLSSLTNLTFLNCNDNNLTSLNLSGLNNLQNLLCSGNNLTSLNANGLSNLLLLSCGNNNLSSLTISGCIALENLSCDYNNLTTLNLTNISSLITLRCAYNSLSSITLTGLVNLKDIICDHNQLTTLNLNGLNSIENLICNNNTITTLNAGNFSSLMTLVCSYNQMTSLNVTGSNNLTKIDCRNNSLPSISLNGLFNLESLYIGINQLTDLNLNGLINLEIVECYQNHISNLNVSGLLNLTYLNCNSNQMNSLILGNLIYLENLTLSGNYITSIDISGLSGLKGLNCSFNLLTTLNASGLSPMLSLDCKNNQLTTLYVNGLNNLTTLYCQNNLLTSLDLSTLLLLNFLDCTNNLLNSLNLNGLTNFQYLNAQTNNLTSLFIKNGVNEQSLGLYNNPNLSYICADETQFTALQNLLNALGYTNCHINSYCSFVPGGTFYTIQGNSRLDSNGSGCDVNDINVANQRFTIASGSVTGSIIANQTGAYSIPIQSGNYTITPVLENPSYFNVSPTSTMVSFPASISPFTQNFCVIPNGVHNDLEVTILPIGIARPGFDATYKIVYKNKGNQISSGTVSLSYNDVLMDLVNTNPINSSSATNILSWDYTNLNPFEIREIIVVFNINAPTETPAVNNGDVLTFTSNISIDSDETPNDNSFTLAQTVVNSFDPNDKTCLEGTKITPNMVGEYVHYVIRFENTGTTPAENIVVADVIDGTKFELESLIPLQSSHDFYTKINNTTGKVEFIFENINLPFDDATNDGYVAFKIRTKPTLIVGDTFSNTANIYFDYNFPITTNTTTTTVALLSNQDFDFRNYFSLYPNPTKNILTITNNQQINISSLSIYNSMGQLIEVITTPNETIDVSNLQVGIYYLKLITDNGMTTQEFIKK